MRLGLIECGEYRIYFHFGRIGFKIARPSGPNWLATFFAACAMNVLERKRYLYYTKLKPARQWKCLWKRDYPIALNPTYFSCGLFSIVRHCSVIGIPEDKYFSVLYKGEWISCHDTRLHENIFDDELRLSCELFACLLETAPGSKAKNVGLHENKLYAIDYGDFSINEFNATRVSLIDYK